MSTVWKALIGMSAASKALVGAALGVVIVAGVLIVLLGAGGSQDEDAPPTEGITLDQFHAVAPGASQDEVVGRFGRPEERQDEETEVSARDEPERSSCLYYPERGRQLDEGLSFQFCFIEGKLDSKNSF